jgi:hypothetical protein
LKTCTKCNEKKRANFFSKDKTLKDGLSSVCKLCKNTYKTSWYQSNKEREKTSLIKRFYRLQNAAKALNKGFDLTFEKYSELISQNCYYCKSDLSKEGGYSIDRADSNLGYIYTNIVPCCGTCNRCKSDQFSMEEWKIAMNAVLALRQVT